MLTGAVLFRTVSAAEVEMRRAPEEPARDGFQAPSAAASGFRLPELPVAFRIDRLDFPVLRLADAVLGAPAAMAVAMDATTAVARAAAQCRTPPRPLGAPHQCVAVPAPQRSHGGGGESHAVHALRYFFAVLWRRCYFTRVTCLRHSCSGCRQ